MASILRTLSDELAAAAEAVAPSVVQVHGPRRAAAGVVFDTDLVLTSSRGLDAGPASVRGGDGVVHEGTVLGRGRMTSLAVVRVPGLGAPAATTAVQPLPGHLAQAVGRTWSGGLFVAFAPVAVVRVPGLGAPAAASAAQPLPGHLHHGRSHGLGGGGEFIGKRAENRCHVPHATGGRRPGAPPDRLGGGRCGPDRDRMRRCARRRRGGGQAR